MPGLDGTGPSDRGPLTGKGRGFCILKCTEESPKQLRGFAGLQGVPVGQAVGHIENTGKEMINMPLGNGTGPTGRSAMTGRGAGYCTAFRVPGFTNLALRGRGAYARIPRSSAPYGLGLYGRPHAPVYRARFARWLRGGVGLGRALGIGRAGGRGRGRWDNW